MHILTINSGSTSIKFKLYKMPEEMAIASDKIENIGFKEAITSYRIGKLSKKTKNKYIKK